MFCDTDTFGLIFVTDKLNFRVDLSFYFYNLSFLLSFSHFFSHFIDPTPRWNTHRDSPEMRPYNSLPRGQDVSNYPSLAAHQTTPKSENKGKGTTVTTSSSGHKATARRAHSEDVYAECKSESTQTEMELRRSEGIVEKSVEVEKGERVKFIIMQ